MDRNGNAVSGRAACTPNWFESFLFFALMSGPPKFRARDPLASLEGSIDLVVAIQVAAWVCGALWVLARLYPTVIRRGLVPSVNFAQGIGALFIASFMISLWDSPGFLLSAFRLGQLAVMLAFAWVFTHRFGTEAYFRHLFVGVGILAIGIIAAAYLAPGLVTDAIFLPGETRLRGDYIADAGSVAVIGFIA